MFRSACSWVIAALTLALLSPSAGAEDTGDHFEFTFGFMGGQRDYSDASFAYEAGDGSQSLVAPFENAPFDELTVLGLRWELRGVLSFVRMTMAFDLPFSSFRAEDTRADFDVDGVSQEVIVQAIKPYDLRFGLGGEYSFGALAPYVDLMGGLNWTNASLTAGGQSVSYASQMFNLSVRGGLRVYLRDFFFITVSGEAGFLGNITWNTELSAGFSIGE